MRYAVAGMGRSGIAIAEAVLAMGDHAVVFDEKAAEDPERIATVEQLESKGIEVVTGWHGHFEAGEFDALVASPGFRRNHPAILDAQMFGMEVLSEVEFAYRISKAPIVAITGTNGKSTTTVMTWLALRGLGIDAVLCGNIIGTGYPELTLTEAAHASTPGQVLVAEISSFQLEWVSTFRPRVATVTKVTPDHFDRHPDFQDYLDTKLRIFAGQQADDYAVLPSPLVMTTGLPGGDYPESYALDRVHARVVRYEQDDRLNYDEPHNRINAACAIAIAECLAQDRGIESAREKAIQGLTEFKPLQFRMQVLGEKDGVLVVNNSMCTNPDAVITSSKGLPRRQVLIMGGITKNLDFRPVGAHLRDSAHQVILFGPDPAEMRGMLGINAPYVESLQEAFDHAVASAQSGDAVILAPGCASAYPYANFRERGLAFEEIAKDWLRR